MNRRPHAIIDSEAHPVIARGIVAVALSMFAGFLVLALIGVGK